jgi:NDP-sugar pyrophosphorylase family protein
MQIVIPMSGFGERFRSVGYEVPKPLIEIDGLPMISYVIDMFPGEENIIFICNEEHLNNPAYKMVSILKKYCPTAQIIGIKPHKLGPIHAVCQIEHLLDPAEPIVVNYCDFTCYWDWFHFKRFVKESGCMGAIPAYKGFHPHSLGSTNYAYMLETDGWIQDIQEKQPYTDNRMEEYASSGTYYFLSAQVMNEAFSTVIEQDLNLDGEYYVSLAYKPILEQNMPVAVYPIQHFMQWGTPEDVTEYHNWSSAFRGAITQASVQSPNGTVIIPMGGMGQRFSDEGYILTKPLIPVSGLPMVIQAIYDLPPAKNYIFVMRNDMYEYKVLSKKLIKQYPNAIIKLIENVTDGQACTAQIGIEVLEDTLENNSEHITIGACDNGALYNYEAFSQLIMDSSVDIIVWSVRGYPNAIRNPEMYGWIDVDDGLIRNISVKKPLGEPERDPIVLGTFTFRRSSDYSQALKELIARNGQINGEFYIDSLINDAIEAGLKCCIFEVDNYLCWGTPNDLKTFEYWQSCFHKWDKHPYLLDRDSRIPEDQLKILKARYQDTIISSAIKND